MADLCHPGSVRLVGVPQGHCPSAGAAHSCITLNPSGELTLPEGSDASPSPGDSLHTQETKVCSSLLPSKQDSPLFCFSGFSEPSGIIISYQTPARLDEEMEAALTDMSKCGLQPWATGAGPFLLCHCHPLIQLSCNNNKPEVYRLCWAEWKKRGSFINIAGAR